MHSVIIIGAKKLPNWAMDSIIPAHIACTLLGNTYVSKRITKAYAIAMYQNTYFQKNGELQLK
jgi:hypothetical protein